MNSINILIIDDNQKKIEDIIENLKKNEYFSCIETEVAINIIQAKKYMKDEIYDLVILDMQMPRRTGDNINRLGGLEILKGIKNKSLCQPTHVVGLSAFQESIDQVLNDFEEQLLMIINYDATTDEWYKKLNEKIRQIIENKNHRHEEKVMKSKYDIALVCALEDPELKSILNLECNFKLLEIDEDQTTDYYEGYFIKDDGQKITIIATSCPQMGMPTATLVSTKLINMFKPKYIIMTGITAGVEGKVNLGDIIIAESCWDYDSGKKTSDINGSVIHQPDYRILRLDTSLVRASKRLAGDASSLATIKEGYMGPKPNTSLVVHLGSLASGGAVIANEEIINGITNHARKLLGIDMESYGIYLSAHYSSLPSPKAIVIKGVCDYANSSKNDDYQNYASYVSAQAFLRLAKYHLNYQE